MKIVALGFLLLLSLALFYQTYLHHLLPFPGNLLVSFYFPWNSGGFSGFDPWTTHKGVTSMDAIRMMYPWKTLAFDIIKSGHFPAWNPYNFSGMPLVGNFQSSVFFPLNILFLILPYLTAWILLIISLPFLFSVFIYLFLRSAKLSVLAAVFGAVVVSTISYLVMWAEISVVIQSIVFIPLVLWAFNRYADTKRMFYLWLTPLFLAFCIFGGYPVTFLYGFSICFVYALFKRVPIKFLGLIFGTALLISSVQLLPAAKLYFNSAREEELAKSIVSQTALPWPNLVTILAPDFYGNPSVGNFRGVNYDNSLAYFGIVALALSIYAIVKRHKDREVRFWFIIGVLGLLFALPPFAYLILLFRVPVLSTTYLSRSDFYFEFSLAILAAFGLDSMIKKGMKISWREWLPYILLGALYAVLLTVTKIIKTTEAAVSFRNLIVPGSLFVVSVTILNLARWRKLANLAAMLLILLAIFEAGYFFNKYQPFSPTKFVFPDHPVFDFLRNEAGYDRFFGVDMAYIDNNFATYYRVYTVEGYDPMFIRRYARLLASSDNGVFRELISDHDALIPREDDALRQRLFDLLGVKYIIDKTDSPTIDVGQNFAKFTESRYGFIKQVGKFKFYERRTALPRAYLVGNYTIESQKEKIITKLYDLSWDPRNSVVVEINPKVSLDPTAEGTAKITNYSPNDVLIETSSRGQKMLVLSDSYYPGWKALIDGKETEIYRANYALRAVVVPAGQHVVKMTYDPQAFDNGLALTLISGVVWLGGLIILRRKEK